MTARSLFVALALSAAASAFVTGCGGTDGKISLDTSNATLTDKPNDFLFAVKLDDARSEGYAPDALTVKVTLPGKDAVALVCTAKDANGNGKIEKGESLSCNEGATNVFDAQIAGKQATVELSAKIDGKDDTVGDTTWTPK